MSPRNLSILLLVVNALAWSTLGVYIRILGQHFAILQQIYLRVIVAGVLLFLLGYRQISWRRMVNLSGRDWLLIVMRTTTMYLFGVGLTSVAFLNGEYSTISLIRALPVTALFGFLIFRERVTRLKMLFMVLSALGASLLVVPDLFGAAATGVLSLGYAEGVALLSACFFAFSYGARTWQRATINNWESTFLMFLTGFPILIVSSWLMGEPPLPVENILLPDVLFAAGLSGALNAIGLVVINYAMGHINIALTNNLFALQPMFGVFVGVLLYRDEITIWEILGGVVIIGSLVGMNQASVKSIEK